MRGIGGKPEALGSLMASETARWREVGEPIAATVVQ